MSKTNTKTHPSIEWRNISKYIATPLKTQISKHSAVYSVICNLWMIRTQNKMDSFNYFYFLYNWCWKNRIPGTSTNAHSMHLIICFSTKENTMEMTPQYKSDHSLQHFMVVVLLFSSLNITRTIKHFKKLIPY